MNKIKQQIEIELKVAEAARLGYSIINDTHMMVALCNNWIESLNNVKAETE